MVCRFRAKMIIRCEELWIFSSIRLCKACVYVEQKKEICRIVGSNHLWRTLKLLGFTLHWVLTILSRFASPRLMPIITLLSWMMIKSLVFGFASKTAARIPSIPSFLLLLWLTALISTRMRLTMMLMMGTFMNCGKNEEMKRKGMEVELWSYTKTCLSFVYISSYVPPYTSASESSLGWKKLIYDAISFITTRSCVLGLWCKRLFRSSFFGRVLVFLFSYFLFTSFS